MPDVEHRAAGAPPPDSVVPVLDSERAEHLPRRHVPGAARIRARELPGFTRELAALLGAGVPLVEALETLQDAAVGPFRTVISGVAGDIRHGARFTKALAHYPAVFDVMYVNMLRAGEVSGRLSETLDRLASYLEASVELRQKVGAAMTYPAVVVTLAVVLFGAMLVFIVPAFEKIYADLGGTLPLPTRILIGMSQILRHHLPLALAGLAVVLAVWRIWTRHTRVGALARDRLLLALPVFGLLNQKIAITRFAESLSQMLKNGIPILQALDLAAHAAGNTVLQRGLVSARVLVAQGRPLSEALRRNRHYPALLIKMLAVGEKTGKADEMLERVAAFYRNEVTVMLTKLTSLVEPVLIIFLGVVIGGMVTCMFIPIFKMHELVAM